MFVAPIAQAWFPRLTQLYASKNIPELVETYHRGSQLVSIGMGSASIIFMVFGRALLQVWTQNTELAERTAPLLALLSLGNLLNGLMHIPYQTQLAYGWTSLSLRINTIAVMFIVPSLFLATRYYGPIGAAFVWSALNAGYLLIGVHFMYRRILVGERWRWYIEDIIFPLLSGLCIAFGIRWMLPQDRMGIMQQIALLLLASTCTVFATVLAARNIRGVFLATFSRLINRLSKAS
jgi:O-antigen/teichoic acid export membrane protein